MSSHYRTHTTLNFLFQSYADHRDLHSFPTRRSSDLRTNVVLTEHLEHRGSGHPRDHARGRGSEHEGRQDEVGGAASSGDRKSTRLNSSHQIISYAVFCLKKKKLTSSTEELALQQTFT